MSRWPWGIEEDEPSRMCTVSACAVGALTRVEVEAGKAEQAVGGVVAAASSPRQRRVGDPVAEVVPAPQTPAAATLTPVPPPAPRPAPWAVGVGGVATPCVGGGVVVHMYI